MSEFAYIYHDWADEETYPSLRERYNRLNKHIGEVSALLITDTSGTDHSTSTVALQKYHAVLMAEKKTMGEELNAGSYNPFQRVKRVRG